ncbi:MAG: ATP-binding cassette domain-containing protein [Planctomycetota bacterium]|nr:ATP-binding cassette domain-containing protein [Planctomycetota bacterium]MDA1211823.1 ATP-binding cassette domain-containing protein [Planctomycetota bacterium]
MPDAATNISGLIHRYGNRVALDNINLSVAAGEIFGLLGPNGGGKTTLFRLLATILPLQQGTVDVLGFDLQSQAHDIRRRIGVTFQSPALDPRLTVRENLKHHGHLYGISGGELRRRIDKLTQEFGLADRLSDRVISLSGGLQRRVEIAKGLLHEPQLLLLDEPSTGLDPGARHDLWHSLYKLREERHVTVLVTTHILEEAERCDRLALLDHGQFVAEGTPDELKSSIGGDCVILRCRNADELAPKLVESLGVTPQKVDETLRLEITDDSQVVKQLLDRFSEEIVSFTWGKPTLEDVFIQRTGHRFWESGEYVERPVKARRH